jgi:CRP-like cAMP-binding protein
MVFGGRSIINVIYTQRRGVPLSALMRKFSWQRLPDSAQKALAKTVSQTRAYSRGERIVEAGERPSQLHLISTGWAARSIVLEDGSKQITDFLLVGDVCDLSALSQSATDHVAALSPVNVTLLDRQALLSAMEDHPRLALAFMGLAFSEQTILRAWMVCLGQRDKMEHVAHLFCELHERLRRLGLAADHSFELPLTHGILAEATGMSRVHVSRTLQRLRQFGVIALHSQHLEILNPRRLREIARFDADYLSG